MRGLLILADGFEDTEALTTRDVLMRAGFDVKTCSISDRLEVESSFAPITTFSISEFGVETSSANLSISGTGRLSTQ